MTTTRFESTEGEADLSEFWDLFQPLSLKWANPFINHSRYLVGSVLFVYLLLAIMTFFPNMGSDTRKVLIDYPSFTLIFLGWTAVIILTVSWRKKIPAIFKWLWESERLGQKTAGLKNDYQQFLQDYQKALQSRKGSLSVGISLVMLLLFLAIATEMPQFLYQSFTLAANILYYVILFVVLFWVFLMGLVSWLFITTSRYIGKLTQQFSIQIQPRHPDKCGGLKPLGDFCLSAAIPLIVGGIFLAVTPILQLDIDGVLSLIATLLLFLVAGPLTMVVVFLPLWNIHLDMVERKKKYADAFTRQIMMLEKEILTNMDAQGDLITARTAREKLEILQSLYPDERSYPAWPFKFGNTLLKILFPQILQLAGEVITRILPGLKE